MSRAQPRIIFVRPDGESSATAPDPDPVWARLRAEAETAAERDPLLAALYFGAILDRPSFEDALVRRLAQRLGSPGVPADLLTGPFLAMLDREAELGSRFRADLTAVVERDPASGRLIEPFLFFKGYAAIQTHRLAHELWRAGRRDLALYLQSRSSEVFQTDIHPAVRIGTGIFLDHATGLVVGETAVIADNVSLLQNVTLGGSGVGTMDRHPKIGEGVMIGAGARVLGPVTIGRHSRIAAGSVVTRDVPDHSTAVGVPARIIAHDRDETPARSMDQTLSDADYASFTYTI